MKPRFEVAQLLQDNWEWIFRNPHLSAHQKRTLAALRDCRTNALGGHVDVCTSCGTMRISYNSCRNRNCPKCQNTQREKWIQARQRELLPIPYFHLVFTIPACLNPYCQSHPRILYNTLFKAAWYTLRQFAADPKHLGVKTGASMVLHTWGQNLMLHPETVLESWTEKFDNFKVRWEIKRQASASTASMMHRSSQMLLHS